ncbi:Holliday junction resolvase RuvX [Ferrimonas balearica]|uniref:Holliday junction resolvase RuvX n=1 Tax=Ferrimonas balearica TaxID=44012 RepID=UPI001C9A2311|nr:Holliday junction resolvase RuvX [Ferrimonas balearica]MBY5992639.1 Holliday junction resolvase RuvX [Ferrimonas balearica]
MSTIMGFDFGAKSIGVAVGQTVTATASPLTRVKARDGIPNWDEVAALIREWQPDKLVVGLPLNMDGSDQHVTRAARKFANRLFGRFGIEAITQDERLTTVDARARLFDEGGYKALKKDQVDALAAALILESYFESLYG